MTVMENILPKIQNWISERNKEKIRETEHELKKLFENVKYEEVAIENDEFAATLIPVDIWRSDILAKKTSGDGNCLYSAVSQLLFGEY